MNTKVTILAAILALSACGGGGNRPKNLIPPQTMVLILRDVHRGEQHVSQLGLRAQDSSLVVFQTLEQRIYQKYGFDSAAYRVSYMHYAAQPEQFKRIYQAVIDSLQAEEERLKKLPARDPGHPQ